MEISFVSQQDDMTAEWFTSMLSGVAGFGDSPVKSVTLEAVSGGVMTRMARATLEFADSTLQPVSLLVKFPVDDEGSLGIAEAMGLYDLEVKFYQEIAPNLTNLNIPKCYFAHMEQRTGRFILALEDLSNVTKPGSGLDTLTKVECEAVFSELANLQAPHWNSSELDRHAWLNNTARTQGLFDSIPAGLVPFLARFGDKLDPNHVELFERVLPRSGEWIRSWAQPKVLQHGEFRSGNVLFGTVPGAPPVTIIDFQTVRIGPPGVDPAYFMGASMPSEDRRIMERDIIEGYHERLLGAGVLDFDLNACWDAYRNGAMYGVFLLVGMAGQVEQSEVNDNIILGLVQRVATMALDIDAPQAAGLI